MRHHPSAQLVASLICMAAVNCLKCCEAHSYLQYHGRLLEPERRNKYSRALITLYSMVRCQRVLCHETLPAMARVGDPAHRSG